ncbi:MAG: tetratricopeptide repeat protein [Magnetococcales bacterium]|nr:tetratricopeptide repeat protein [Magnetococcales bacterium]
MITDEEVYSFYQSCHAQLISWEGDNLEGEEGGEPAFIPQIFRGITGRLWEGNAPNGCARHLLIFDHFKIIPEYCFSCYKVTITLHNVVELFKLVILFDKLKLPKDNTRKCMVELRPNVSGHYKGLIYCQDLLSGQEMLKIIREILKKNLPFDVSVVLKRGCSEYPPAYPEYAKITENGEGMMQFNEEWRMHEEYADKNLMGHLEFDNHDRYNSKITTYDAKIMRAWLAYAAVKGDLSYLEIFQSEDTLSRGVFLYKFKSVDEAVTNYQKALASIPDNPEAYCSLGIVFREQGRLDEAKSSYREALALNPNYPKAHCGLGEILKKQGRLDEARRSFQKALSLNPDYLEALCGLGYLSKCSDFTEIEKLKRLLNQFSRVKDKIDIYFLLGKNLVDLGKETEAESYFLEGNRLQREIIKFDLSEEAKIFRQFSRTFDRIFFASRDSYGNTDFSPVFIIGLPCSGVGQVQLLLAEYQNVYGAGEIAILKEIVLQRMSSGRKSMIPYTVSRMNSDTVRELGREYLERLQEVMNRCYALEKTPEYFLYIGIVILLFPNAKIIHSVRSKEELSSAIFRRNLSKEYCYASNIDEIIQYYNLYCAIMDHWKKVFPSIIYDVSYERLIAGKEAVRDLVEFCDLVIATKE